MAAARLSAYLRTVKTLSEQQYGNVREVISDTFQLDIAAINSRAAEWNKSLFVSRPDGVAKSKSIGKLILLSCAVCGIELCYAAETAFVSPTLLRLGIPTTLATLTWCLSPLLGLVLGPVLGSLSDRCQSFLGRRRPFILLLSVGILLGLILVPHGQQIGVLLGDDNSGKIVGTETIENVTYWGTTDAAWSTVDSSVNENDVFKERSAKDFNSAEISSSWSPTSASPVVSFAQPLSRRCLNITNAKYSKACRRKWLQHSEAKAKSSGKPPRRHQPTQPQSRTVATETGNDSYGSDVTTWHPTVGVVLTVVGVVLLDCCCDACQSPCRTYLLDVSQPGDHATGLATFTVMAGLGGSVGYLLGGVVDWKTTDVGGTFGGHVQVR